MTKYARTSPALHTAGTHTHDTHVTQLAREIPTSPAHPIKETEHETISIHTQITEITVTKKKKRNFHHLNALFNT
jgi:hypothetical protein